MIEEREKSDPLVTSADTLTFPGGKKRIDSFKMKNGIMASILKYEQYIDGTCAVTLKALSRLLLCIDCPALVICEGVKIIHVVYPTSVNNNLNTICLDLS